MIPIVGEGSFDATVRAQVNANFQAAAGLSVGNVYYLDPFAGYDGNTGLYPSQAFKNLATGYDALREGKNDVLVLIQNGLATASARLSSAFTWSKNAAHLMGASSGVNISNRSRIAPTAAVSAFANFFAVSGSGCLFQKIQWFPGLETA